MTTLLGSDRETSEISWTYPNWYYDPAVIAARRKCGLAHAAWCRVTMCDQVTEPLTEPTTELQRVIHGLMVASDVAYEAAKRRAMGFVPKQRGRSTL